MTERRDRFRERHAEGLFVMPNAWDVGSARLFEGAGADAIATTSAGFAASLGRSDQTVTADELLAHAAALAAAVAIPVSVDAERCYDDVSDFIDALAATGVAGFSIEDYDPAAGAVEPIDVAAARVSEAVEAARPHGLVVTARAENHLYGVTDLDDTIGRLSAFRDAGADVVYAPGLLTEANISRVVDEVGIPVNVLILPGAPSVARLGDLGVRRVSLGSILTYVAYAAAIDEFADTAAGGGPTRRMLSSDERSHL